ncbi:uncharacterized protein [Nothobranchius furzeri]|uniref:uncharacterized protein n=1 Tax=Nothobranchius furzeri TaxID=105023 RepID=UPI003904CC2B
MFELKFRRQRSEVTGGRSEERIRMEKVLLCTIAASALCAASSIRYRQYHFIYDPKNWTEAQTYCRQTYTDLVTVDSYSTVTTLNSLADVTQMGSTKHAWIGLYFDVIDWKWSLSDEDFYKNNEATYTNWYPGQPNGIWYTEQCVYMNLAYALWSDNYCNTLFHSVCSNVSGEKWNQDRLNDLKEACDAGGDEGALDICCHFLGPNVFGFPSLQTAPKSVEETALDRSRDVSSCSMQQVLTACQKMRWEKRLPPMASQELGSTESLRDVGVEQPQKSFATYLFCGDFSVAVCVAVIIPGDVDSNLRHGDMECLVQSIESTSEDQGRVQGVAWGETAKAYHTSSRFRLMKRRRRLEDKLRSSSDVWVCFTQSDFGLFSGGNVTFVLNSNLMNWTDAQRYCRQHYTDLASVRNLSENAQIRKQITAPAWIGLYKSTWKWSNGPFFMYNYWQVLEPDGGDEKCTAANFANSGRWMDLACGLEKPFVCYHDPVPLWRTGIKLKLVKTSALRLEDPAVQEDLLQQFYVSAKTEADEPKRDRRRGTELEEATQQRRLLPRQDQQKLGSRFLVFVQIFFCS